MGCVYVRTTYTRIVWMKFVIIQTDKVRTEKADLYLGQFLVMDIHTIMIIILL